MTDEISHEPAAAQIAYTHWLEQLRTDMSQTLGGVLLKGARAVQVSADGPHTDGTTPVTNKPASSAVVLVGWALTLVESAAAFPGATVKLRDGVDGPVVIQLVLLDAAPSSVQSLGPSGVQFTRGIVVESDFQVVGSVFLRGTD